MKIMNVGFVGCGGFTQGVHIPSVRNNPNFRIKALCDLNESILAELNTKYAPDYVTTDFNRIALDSNIEMVIIGTTPNVRVEPIRAMAEHGKHMYVEKPMSLGYEDSKIIVDIVNRTGVKLQVGFNRSYSAIMQQAKKVFKQIRKNTVLISYRIVGEDILWPKFHYDNVVSDKSNTIIHETTHIFDLLNWFTDSKPLRVYVIGGKSDNNILALEYPGNIYVSIVSGSCGTEAYPKEQMEVFTDNKVITMEDFVELRFTRIPGQQDMLFPLKSNPSRAQANSLSFSDLRHDLMKWRDALTCHDIEQGYYYHSRPCVDKGHKDALQFLYEAIRNNMPTQTDQYSGAVSTITGIEAVKSLHTGLPINLDFSFLNDDKNS